MRKKTKKNKRKQREEDASLVIGPHLLFLESHVILKSKMSKEEKDARIAIN